MCYLQQPYHSESHKNTSGKTKAPGVWRVASCTWIAYILSENMVYADGLDWMRQGTNRQAIVAMTTATLVTIRLRHTPANIRSASQVSVTLSGEPLLVELWNRDLRGDASLQVLVQGSSTAGLAEGHVTLEGLAPLRFTLSFYYDRVCPEYRTMLVLCFHTNVMCVP